MYCYSLTVATNWIRMNDESMALPLADRVFTISNMVLLNGEYKIDHRIECFANFIGKKFDSDWMAASTFSQ